MKKKNKHNKSEYIQFRVDSEVKQKAKITAENYFGGNMSIMFRYALYKCDFEKTTSQQRDNNRTNYLDCASASLSDDIIRWLEKVNEEYDNENKQLAAIGNNVNQLAHQANGRATVGKSPITSDTLSELKGIKASITSLRSSNGRHWKEILNKFMNNSKGYNP